MNIERIIQLNEWLNEVKDKDPEFESFRKRLEVIFSKTADYYKKAVKEFGNDDPEISNSIKQDMNDYERLSRLAKSGTNDAVSKAWRSLDTAPMETAFDFMTKEDKKIFMKLM